VHLAPNPADAPGSEAGRRTDGPEIAPELAARLARALDRSPSAIVVFVDSELRIQWLSSSAAWVTGSDPHGRRGTSSLERIHPDDVGRLLHGLEQLRAAGPSRGPGRPVPGPLRYRFQRFDDDRWVVMEAQIHNLLDDPVVNGMLVISRPVDGELDGVGHVIDLLVANAPLTTALAACADLVPAYVGAAAVVGFVGGNAVVGSSRDPAAESLATDDRWWRDVVADGTVRAPVDFAGFPDDLTDKARAEGFRTAWVSPLFDGSAGEVIGCLLVWARIAGKRDIVSDDALRQTERLASMVIGEQRRHEALRHDAMTDPLTNVGNRAVLQRRLDTASGPITMAIMDLDDFKPVNDIHGHDVGDAVLQVVAKRLVATVRDDDLVARFGGDEFAVVFSDGTASGDVVNTEQRILDSIEAPIKVRDDLALSVTASIGYATDEPTAVLKAADAALYRAKQARLTAFERVPGTAHACVHPGLGFAAPALPPRSRTKFGL
jgi:diguanylate cyclase (GGDEF)-like protein